MDSDEKRTCEKRQRLRTLFKKHEAEETKENYNPEFNQYSQPKKEKFFKMLKMCNHKVEKKKDVPVVASKTIKEKEEPKFKIPFPVSSRSKNNKLSESETAEQILELNATIMREVLHLKWERILLEEGCLEDVLNWNQHNNDLPMVFEHDGEFLEGDFSLPTFFNYSQDDDGSFDL